MSTVHTIASSKRCRHPNAYIVRRTANDLAVKCDDCVLLWQGRPFTWFSHRQRPHSPPQWVQKLIAARTDATP